MMSFVLFHSCYSEGTARAARLALSAVTGSAVGGYPTRSVVAGRVSPTTSGSSTIRSQRGFGAGRAGIGFQITTFGQRRADAP